MKYILIGLAIGLFVGVVILIFNLTYMANKEEKMSGQIGYGNYEEIVVAKGNGGANTVGGASGGGGWIDKDAMKIQALSDKERKVYNKITTDGEVDPIKLAKYLSSIKK